MNFKFPFIKTSKTAPRGKVTSRSERIDVITNAYRDDKGMDAPNKKARPWIEFVSDYKLTKLTDYDSYMQAGTSKLWASFKAIDTIAKFMVSVPFRAKKNEVVIDNEEHPLVKFLTEPNPFDSWEDILYTWPFHIKFTGNAYWLKDEIDGKGRPSAVYPILPQFIEVVPDRDKRIKQYIYRVNGRTIIIEPEEMIHFKNPHPNNVIFGLGDIEAGEMMFEDYINRNKLESHYLSKGGVPSGVLVREEEIEDEDEWKRFTTKWKSEYEGLDNTGKTAFLNGKWNYVKLGLTPSELQTMERSKVTVQNIFTLHGVPLSVAGVERAANYATSRQDTIHFKKHTLMPLLDMFCGKLNSGKTFTRNFDPALRMSYELGGLADVAGIVSEFGPIVDKGGMTRNELRVMCELPEIKGKPMMDEFLINQGLVPIDMAGAGGVAPEKDLKGITKQKEEEDDAEDLEPDDNKEPKKPKAKPDKEEE